MTASSKKALLLLVLLAAVALVRFSGLQHELTFEQLQLRREFLKALVNEHYAVATAVYVALYILVTALSLPGAAIMTLAGGYLFGMVAIISVNLGATIGASLAFLMSRSLARDWVRIKYGNRFPRFEEELQHNGHNYLLSLRLIPVVPFFLINILSGLSSIRYRTFLWTTALGILPGSVVFVYAGTQLAALRTTSDILSPGIALSLGLLALLALMPILVRRWKNTHRNNH